MQLETQLKQKTVQMDNLDNTLSVTKKELAEQRREKELAEQVQHQQDTTTRKRRIVHALASTHFVCRSFLLRLPKWMN